MNDMETKQIINWLRDKADRADNPSWTRMMHKAADRLKELDQAQNWIPVAERLPEVDCTVLVIDRVTGNVTTAYLNVFDCFVFMDGRGHGARYWMPLPEPPGR